MQHILEIAKRAIEQQQMADEIIAKHQWVVTAAQRLGVFETAAHLASIERLIENLPRIENPNILVDVSGREVWDRDLVDDLNACEGLRRLADGNNEIEEEEEKPKPRIGFRFDPDED